MLPEVKELVVLRQSSPEMLLQLSEAMTERIVLEGEVIAEQGQPDDSMYVIAEGEVIVEIPFTGGREERLLSRGSYIGAECLLGNAPQKRSAKAKTACKLLRLDRSSFDSIIFSQSYEEDEEEEDEDGDTCLAKQLVNIFVVSDSTGESASASVKTAAAQFEYCSGSTCANSRATVFRFVRSAAEIKTIVSSAERCKGLLVGASLSWCPL